MMAWIWVNIGWANDLLTVQHQAIAWTNAGLLSIGLQGKLIQNEFFFFFQNAIIMQ